MPMAKVGKKEAISKPEFHRRLRDWFANTSEDQIAEGEASHIIIKDGEDFYRFDADTSREAVGDYLERVDQFGDSILWTAVLSQRGQKTKIAVGPKLVKIDPLYLYIYPIKREKSTDQISWISPDEADESKAPTRSKVDVRQVLRQQIRARRGQKKFRDALLQRYMGTCLVTGCQIVDILEAAHIRINPGLDDNTPENGLLLRADIHTLFDLNLLGIDPTTFEVRLHASISDSEYATISGKTLRDKQGRPLVECQLKPSAEALQTRFDSFLA